MNQTTLATLGFFVLIAAPALADCPKGQVEKVPGKGTDGKEVSFCIRDADVTAFDKWAARCKQQSAVRVTKGAKKEDVPVVFYKDDKGVPRCHIDAAHVAESGAIDD